MSKQVVIASLVSGIAGAAIGGVVTYLTVKKTFQERAQRDIDEVKEKYKEMYDGKRVVSIYPEEPVLPEGMTLPEGSNITKEQIDQAREFVKQLNYQAQTSEEKPSEKEEEETLSIYDRQEKPKTKEVENKLLVGYDGDALRAAHKPYLISSEEFYNTETEWDKLSISYYEDDDTLADDQDKEVVDKEYLIGEVHLEFFGIRSGDPNIVFVRNPQISTDFEVTRNSSSFGEVVLGLEKGAEFLGTRQGRDEASG